LTPSAVIAIVDDDELVRESLAGLIRSFGVSTVTFACADELLARGVEGFDCVISDLQMPGIGGLELRRILAKTNNALPVVLMTAFPDRVPASGLGEICALVEKPIDQGVLVACLTKALGRPIG
jgi:FixJ family two-component response regulator